MRTLTERPERRDERALPGAPATTGSKRSARFTAAPLVALLAATMVTAIACGPSASGSGSPSASAAGLSQASGGVDASAVVGGVGAGGASPSDAGSSAAATAPIGIGIAGGVRVGVRVRACVRTRFVCDRRRRRLGVPRGIGRHRGRWRARSAPARLRAGRQPRLAIGRRHRNVSRARIRRRVRQQGRHRDERARRRRLHKFPGTRRPGTVPRASLVGTFPADDLAVIRAERPHAAAGHVRRLVEAAGRRHRARDR